MDRIQTMSVFVAVAETGGFAAAARKLGMSPPSATRAVAELEDRLGAKLLHRTTRTVDLTEAGARYLADSRRILADLAEADRHAAGVHAAPVGEVKVSASVLFGRMVVAPALLDLLDAHPGLTISALFVDRVVNVAEEEIDVAVRIAELPDSGLQAIRVGQVRRVIVAAPDYAEVSGLPATPAELFDHDVIDFVNASRTPTWAFRRRGRTEPARIRARFTVNAADAAIDAARAGKGLARVLSYMVAEDIAAGRLVLALEDFALPPTPVHVLHREPGLTSARVRAVVDGLTTALRGCPLLTD